MDSSQGGYTYFPLDDTDDDVYQQSDVGSTAFTSVTSQRPALIQVPIQQLETPFSNLKELKQVVLEDKKSEVAAGVPQDQPHGEYDVEEPQGRTAGQLSASSIQDVASTASNWGDRVTKLNDLEPFTIGDLKGEDMDDEDDDDDDSMDAKVGDSMDANYDDSLDGKGLENMDASCGNKSIEPDVDESLGDNDGESMDAKGGESNDASVGESGGASGGESKSADVSESEQAEGTKNKLSKEEEQFCVPQCMWSDSLKKLYQQRRSAQLAYNRKKTPELKLQFMRLKSVFRHHFRKLKVEMSEREDFEELKQLGLKEKEKKAAELEATRQKEQEVPSDKTPQENAAARKKRKYEARRQKLIAAQLLQMQQPPLLPNPPNFYTQDLIRQRIEREYAVKALAKIFPNQSVPPFNNFSAPKEVVDEVNPNTGYGKWKPAEPSVNNNARPKPPNMYGSVPPPNMCNNFGYNDEYRDEHNSFYPMEDDFGMYMGGGPEPCYDGVPNHFRGRGGRTMNAYGGDFGPPRAEVPFQGMRYGGGGGDNDFGGPMYSRRGRGMQPTHMRGGRSNWGSRYQN